MRLKFMWTHADDKTLYQRVLVYPVDLPVWNPSAVVEELLQFSLRALQILKKADYVVFVHDVFHDVPDEQALAHALIYAREAIVSEINWYSELVNTEKLNNTFFTPDTVKTILASRNTIYSAVTD